MWRIEGGASRVYIMGAAPASATPWRSEYIEGLLSECAVFWNETPESGPDTIPLAIQYGVVTGRPLASWLDGQTLSRVERLAQVMDFDAAMLSAVRPWLACQLLQNRARERAGIPFSNGCDPVLSKLAEDRGMTVRHEFETLESLMKRLISLSLEAEAGYLNYYMDELQAAEGTEQTRHNRWADGDILEEDRTGRTTAARYPEFYSEMVIARNEDWIPRLEAALSSAGATFFLIGTGHLVGPENLIALARGRGWRPERV